MEEGDYSNYYDQGYPQAPNVSNLEEKMRIMRDRVLLMGKNLIDDREKTFMEIQEMKKEILKLKEDNLRMKEILQNIAEQTNDAAKKEELMILQRQFDLFRNE